ncbi:uncharacterized protein B0H18DRAFT_1095853 [Fomitopsis serialis]|uniref:uncharacterized protein n=1 Tax=Fomitopsis serialis TaxID=139415 RepID=UPI0020083B8E|nr:uncharacterized protein B0H18DRAFT_1095853 [Neoantrodia serialis]KAH9920684.1 hypothetical protein B0H18DRAFT_1095853 [Neoantrodia serialis]
MSAGIVGDRPTGSQNVNINGHAQVASAPAGNLGGRVSVDHGMPSAPEVHLNGRPASSMSRRIAGEEWGANFWVTLSDPQTQVSFYACPATGEVSWDPPIGNFLLPANPEGEWWEMIDEASGLPYYYHTKSGETVWERPEAFVIPLAILQNTALGRRLSARRSSPKDSAPQTAKPSDRVLYNRANSYRSDQDLRQSNSAKEQQRRSQSATRSSPSTSTGSPINPGAHKKTPPRRSATGGDHVRSGTTSSGGPLAYPRGHPLAPIPGSPYMSDASAAPSRKSMSAQSINDRYAKSQDAARREEQREGEDGAQHGSKHDSSTVGRSRSKTSSYLSYRAPQPQSLSAALEMIALSDSQSTTSSVSTDKLRTASENGHGERSAPASLLDPRKLRISTEHGDGLHTAPASPNPMWSRGKKMGKMGAPPSPRRPIPALPHFGGARSVSSPTPAIIKGNVISTPIYNADATRDMSQTMNPGTVPPKLYRQPTHVSTASLNTGNYPILPHELSSDIQQFAESHFARQYFSTHRVGFLFKRKIPVEQMMSWQKAPLSSPLLQFNRSLHKNALKIFKAVQHIMGDRERERGGMRFGAEGPISSAAYNASTTSLPNPSQAARLEDERWLLSEGIAHGELRDEIYCQVMKQLNGNPSAESVFKGWQLLCVLLVTFPPSKDFETYLRSYLQQATMHQEGRIDVLAKYCLRRLAYISRKGPRGKPPTTAEIETASDAAFHPSIFGESLDTIFRLQERSYPHMKVPIILPFLADGILALGGTKTEGIFRVPGDGDSVSELKLRIEKGYYSLDGIDDPHILASLVKLWLRELCDPLVPDELYDECIRASQSPEVCVSIVQRLPTINRRVVLFVISFLQLFLEEKICSVTKMTSQNLALVMTPNLLRCNSDSIAVIFTNAQYEQTFVHNLLLHLRCDVIDPDYIPAHGQGAVRPTSPPPKNSQGRRRLNH